MAGSLVLLGAAVAVRPATATGSAVLGALAALLPACAVVVANRRRTGDP